MMASAKGRRLMLDVARRYDLMAEIAAKRNAGEAILLVPLQR